MWLWLRSPLEVLLDDEGDAEDDGGGADKPATSHHHLLAGLLAWAEKRVGEEGQMKKNHKSQETYFLLTLVRRAGHLSNNSSGSEERSNL